MSTPEDNIQIEFDPTTIPAVYANQFMAQINDEGVRILFGEGSATKPNKLEPRVALFFTHKTFADMQRAFMQMQQEHAQKLMAQTPEKSVN